MLRAAIALEPGYARAHALLGWAKWWAAHCYWFDDTREGYRRLPRMRRTRWRSIPADPWARMVSGLCFSHGGSARTRARRVARRADAQSELRARPHGLWLGAAAGGRSSTRRSPRPARRCGSARSTISRASTRRSTGWPCSARSASTEALPFLRTSVAAFAEYSGHYNTLISCCGHLGLTRGGAGIHRGRATASVRRCDSACCARTCSRSRIAACSSTASQRPACRSRAGSSDQRRLHVKVNNQHAPLRSEKV